MRVAGFYGRYQPQGGERKFLDTLKAETTIAATGTIMDDSLNHIAQGADESERVGRKCTIRSLHIRGYVLHDSGTNLAQTTDIARIIVYLDKQCNGAAATPANILEDVTGTNGVVSFRSLQESGRFKILMDRTIVPASTAGAGDTGTGGGFGESYKPFQFHKRCFVPVEFSGATGAIAEIRSNNIGIMAISQDGTAKLRYTARIRYSDA